MLFHHSLSQHHFSVIWAPLHPPTRGNHSWKFWKKVKLSLRAIIHLLQVHLLPTQGIPPTPPCFPLFNLHSLTTPLLQLWTSIHYLCSTNQFRVLCDRHLQVVYSSLWSTTAAQILLCTKKTNQSHLICHYCLLKPFSFTFVFCCLWKSPVVLGPSFHCFYLCKLFVRLLWGFPKVISVSLKPRQPKISIATSPSQNITFLNLVSQPFTHLRIAFYLCQSAAVPSFLPPTSTPPNSLLNQVLQWLQPILQKQKVIFVPQHSMIPTHWWHFWLNFQPLVLKPRTPHLWLCFFLTWDFRRMYASVERRMATTPSSYGPGSYVSGMTVHCARDWSCNLSWKSYDNARKVTWLIGDVVLVSASCCWSVYRV